MLPDVPGPAGPGGLDNAPLGVILRTYVAPIPVRIPAPNSVRTSSRPLDFVCRVAMTGCRKCYRFIVLSERSFFMN